MRWFGQRERAAWSISTTVSNWHEFVVTEKHLFSVYNVHSLTFFVFKIPSEKLVNVNILSTLTVLMDIVYFAVDRCWLCCWVTKWLILRNYFNLQADVTAKSHVLVSGLSNWQDNEGHQTKPFVCASILFTHMTGMWILLHLCVDIFDTNIVLSGTPVKALHI